MTTLPDNQDSDELSSQMRNTLMVFVSKFILFLCIPLAGFGVYILNLTEQNINTRADNKIMQMERKYIKNIVSLEMLEKKMKAYKEYHAKEMMNVVAVEFQKLQSEIVTKEYMASIEKDLQLQISRNYLKSKSNLDRYKLDLVANEARAKSRISGMRPFLNTGQISLQESFGGKTAMPTRIIKNNLRR